MPLCAMQSALPAHPSRCQGGGGRGYWAGVSLVAEAVREIIRDLNVAETKPARINVCWKGLGAKYFYEPGI